MRYFFLFCFLYLSYITPATAEEFLRLFTSPEERQALDLIREYPEPFLQQKIISEKEIVTPPPMEITFNGFVKRQNNVVVTWVNDAELTTVEQTGFTAKVIDTKKLNTSAQLLIVLSQQATEKQTKETNTQPATFRLKVGQILETHKNQTIESYLLKSPSEQTAHDAVVPPRTQTTPNHETHSP
ncbi:hypothetical protein BegalDRAFT_0813 [Beggiatoa alba B18LD]|uniref:Uncharacterized protein n=1 Tax=Beggiatoa alba B18LD TaxID=395493 RepID=I3CDN1_9GAMM|nr:hypothetical protein [Beggiatoa alba]EIJ41724.1 hypothetical protein BegalDRAFT_0813 [Beggiatoa alba B18LD]